MIMFFNWDHLGFRYRPFPIGIARPVMDSETYRKLVDSYPPVEVFTDLSQVGSKLTLSERFNRESYERWVRGNPIWREFYEWIKSDAFVDSVLSTLRRHHIDIGYSKETTAARRFLHRFGDFVKGRSSLRSVRLRSRFEFSMLPAQGGHVLPHTDGQSKLVTLVVSMVREGEWDPSWGGGTDVNQPRDETQSFNRLNRQLPFEEVEILDTFELEPNQAVVFVKTFNSWHSVRPMAAPDPKLWRKTLTINIEAPI
jgi:hypothetical protein